MELRAKPLGSEGILQLQLATSNAGHFHARSHEIRPAATCTSRSATIRFQPIPTYSTPGIYLPMYSAPNSDWPLDFSIRVHPWLKELQKSIDLAEKFCVIPKAVV